MSVKRYSPSARDTKNRPSVMDVDWGEYVRFDDYAALEARVAGVVAEMRERLDRSISDSVPPMMTKNTLRKWIRKLEGKP
jgi:hypothetical protein